MSSVAYAIEAALRALDGDLALLIPAMSAVLLIIALVVVNYQQLIARYPRGGGASAATDEAFGESRAPAGPDHPWSCFVIELNCLDNP